MSQTATIVYEVRSTGADTNGGGFDSTAAGTDRSQQDAAQVVINNSSIVCSTPGANSNTLTFVSGYTPSSADVGNVVNITAGTNINAGMYSIASQTSTTWVLNSLAGGGNLTTAGGAGSAVTGNMGGALATPGKACAVATGGNWIYVKSATYAMSSSSNVAGGRATMTAGSSGTVSTSRLIGYSTTRSDLGRPTFQASGTTYALITTAGNCSVENIIVDGNNAVGIKGISFIAGSIAKNCKAINCKANGFVGPSGADAVAYFCEATGCSLTPAFATMTCYGCVAHDNTFTGYESCSGSFCIAANNTGATSDGILCDGISQRLENWVLYGNGRDGIRLSSGNAQHFDFINCISYGNTGKGYNFSSGSDNGTLYNCAFGSNTGGNIGGSPASFNQNGNITLTSSPFTNAAGNDFSLNNAGGGGALCRAAGIPGAYSSGMSTTGYIDVGAAQSNLTAAGGVNVGAVSVGF